MSLDDRDPASDAARRDYYQRLDVSPEADADTIRRAFRRKAMKYHPDKGGDRQLFMEVNEAYKVLGDIENRKLYDRYGESGWEFGKAREMSRERNGQPQHPSASPRHKQFFQQQQPHPPPPQQPHNDPSYRQGHHQQQPMQQQQHHPPPPPPPPPSQGAGFFSESFHWSFPFGNAGGSHQHPQSQAEALFREAQDLLTGTKRRSAERRGEDVVFPLPVELLDLYRGLEQQLRILRTTVCPDCDGRGARKIINCPECRGRGCRQQALPMQHPLQSFFGGPQLEECPGCSGAGTTYYNRDQCGTCEGRRVVKEKHSVNIQVRPGMAHNDEIVCQGSADQPEPDMLPGDLIVVLHQKPHPVFKRYRDHLVCRRTISLAEALTGFFFDVEHLDGRRIRFHSEPEAVYRPGDVLVAHSYGMPTRANPQLLGDLYVVLEVEFPQPRQLSQEQRTELLRLLAPPLQGDAVAGVASGAPVAASGDVHDVYLEPADIRVSQLLRQSQDAETRPQQHHCRDGDERPRRHPPGSMAGK